MAGFVRDSAIRNITYQGTPISSLNGAGAYNSDPLDVSTFVEAIAFINLSAQTGTSPTLDCKIQYSADQVNWIDSGDSFTQMTTITGVFIKKLTANFGKYIRFVFTLGGTTPVYTITPQVALKA